MRFLSTDNPILLECEVLAELVGKRAIITLVNPFKRQQEGFFVVVCPIWCRAI